MLSKLTSLRKTITRAAALLPFVLLSACLAVPGGGRSSGQDINPGEAVRVALLVPKSAPSADVQRLSRDLESAARLAASDLSGARIDLRVYDTAGQAARAAQVARQAVDDGAKIIIGPLYAETANAAALSVRGDNVNVLAFSNNPSIAGQNLFVLGPTFNNTAATLASYATKRGKNQIVTVYSNNVAGQLGKAAIESAVARSGGRVAGSVGYEFSETGVASAVPRVAQAVRDNGADAIFLTANSAGALPLLSQMLPEAGVSPATTQYIGLSRWDSPPQTLSLPGVQGGWFALPDPGRSAQYVSRFRAAYGTAPHQVSSLAYDGVAAIGALIRQGRRDALKTSGLTQNAGFQGATGVFRLRSDGSNERALAVGSITGGQVVILQPAPTSFGMNLF